MRPGDAGFSTVPFFCFITFSLKRVFFILMALMMQKTITAFSHSLVPSKCSIRNRYFSLRPARTPRQSRGSVRRVSQGLFHTPLPVERGGWNW